MTNKRRVIPFMVDLNPPPERGRPGQFWVIRLDGDGGVVVADSRGVNPYGPSRFFTFHSGPGVVVGDEVRLDAHGTVRTLDDPLCPREGPR